MDFQQSIQIASTHRFFPHFVFDVGQTLLFPVPRDANWQHVFALLLVVAAVAVAQVAAAPAVVCFAAASFAAAAPAVVLPFAAPAPEAVPFVCFGVLPRDLDSLSFHHGGCFDVLCDTAEKERFDGGVVLVVVVVAAAAAVVDAAAAPR